MPLDNPAFPLRQAAAAVLHGRVCGTVPLMVAVDGLERSATRATSCLVAPDTGDEVLVLESGERCILLHVVARRAGGAVVLTHDAGISLRAPVLALEGENSLALRAPSIVVDGEALSVRAAAATVALRSANVLAGVLRTVAERIEQVATHLLANATNRTAVVGGVDVLDVQTAHTKVATTLTIQTGATVVTADTDIRMDAERISLG